MPLERLEELQTLSSFPNWIASFIKHRTPCGRTRPDGRPELSYFIDRVVETLLQDDFAPEGSDKDALRETYKTRLIEVLAFTSGSRCEPLLRDTGALDSNVLEFDDKCSDYPSSAEDLVALQHYATGPTLDKHDMLVAAACVGNFAALERYASKVENLRSYGEVFCCLWKAVIISDQSESLNYLLPQVPGFPRTGTYPNWTRDKRINALMVRAMWHAALTACDYGKMATGKLLIDRFAKEGALWKFTNLGYENSPIKRSMHAGCVELLDYLLENLREHDQKKIHDTIRRAFKEAGRHVEVMRYLLDRKLIWPTAPPQKKYTFKSDPEHPLRVALTSGRIEVLQLLQEYGANFSEFDDLLWEAIDSGVPGFKFRTVEYLCENGAVVRGREFFALQMLMDAVVEGYRRPTIDGCKTLIYVLSKAKTADLVNPPYFTRSEWEKFSADFQHVLDRGLELPVAPMDFAEEAKDCDAWLAKCAAAAPEEW